MSLFDSLSRISEQIQNQRQLINSEQATILVSIQPFIRALGYDTQNLAEVQPEYTADPHSSGTERVDYVIKRDGDPIMLIEVKAASIVLNQHHWKQLHSYFVALDVEFGVLTNGLEYRFYTDTKKNNVMDEEPFLTIDMLKLDASQINILDGFSKTRFAPAQTLRKIKISNLLEKELNRPSNEFVKHFARQVHSGSIFQSVIEEFRPLVKRAWDDLVDQEIARRVRRPEEAEVSGHEPAVIADKTMTSTTTPPIAGSVVEVPVFKTYRGHRVEATLLLGDKLSTGQKILKYDSEILSPSAAAMKAMLSINPNRKSGSNGYWFWRFAHPDTNEETVLNELFANEALFYKLREVFGN